MKLRSGQVDCPTPKSVTRWGSVILATVSLISGSCQPEGLYYGSITPPAQAHLRVGLGATPETLDPHLAIGGPEEHVLLGLFEGLTEYDPKTAAPIRALAERWDINRTATQYIFHLRRDARWSNGDPVTAHDFVFSWQRILDPQTASPFASMLYYLRNGAAFNQRKIRLRDKRSGHIVRDEDGRELVLGSEGFPSDQFDSDRYTPQSFGPDDVGVEALDDFTLKVSLGSPTGYFLSLTPHWTYRPVHRGTIERWGKDWTRPEHIVVNGPFILTRNQSGDKIELSKNSLYREASQVKLDRVTFYLAEDAHALMNLYRVGALDTLASGILPIETLARLREKADYMSGPYLSVYFYMLNVKRPPLDRADVRRALNLSLDRRQICDRLLRSGQRPAYTLTPQAFEEGYHGPSGPGYDPTQARDLMRKSGFPDGLGLQFRLTFNSLPLNQQVAEAIQAQWRSIFPLMQVELVSFEWQVYLDAMRQGNFDIIRRNWTADFNDPISFLELMVSISSNNHTGWSSQSYDDFIEQANSNADQNERMRLLAEAEKLLLDELPFIPIYEGVTFFLIKPYVRGWESNILDKHPLRFIRMAKDQTEQ